MPPPCHGGSVLVAVMFGFPSCLRCSSTVPSRILVTRETRDDYFGQGSAHAESVVHIRQCMDLCSDVRAKGQPRSSRFFAFPLRG